MYDLIHHSFVTCFNFNSLQWKKHYIREREKKARDYKSIERDYKTIKDKKIKKWAYIRIKYIYNLLIICFLKYIYIGTIVYETLLA